MTKFLRTPDENFADLADFPFEPHYLPWKDMRVHYIDEGPKDAPVMLLLHGMPTWAYLYRHVIPGLLDAGYRCIAPDHLGFGRSDKPADENWYTIARHTEVLTSLITRLDLDDITLVCQDWGGPTGLAQAVYMPERFSRLVIMNTWLHHPEYEYSEAIRNWNRNWHEGGLFHRKEPDLGLLLVLSGGFAPPDVVFPALTEGKDPGLTGKAAEVYQGFLAIDGLFGFSPICGLLMALGLTRREATRQVLFGRSSSKAAVALVYGSMALAPWLFWIAIVGRW